MGNSYVFHAPVVASGTFIPKSSYLKQGMLKKLALETVYCVHY